MTTKSVTSLANEQELICRILAGEKELFSELVRPHENSIYTVAVAVMGNETDAEEVVQDSLLKAFQHLGAFRSDARFKTWLYRIAINEARQRLRKSRGRSFEPLDGNHKGEEDGEFVPREFADWRDIPSDVLEKKEIREMLRKAIRSLGPSFRQVFLLRDVEGLTNAEVANLLDISIPAVKTRLLRARLQLRERLSAIFGKPLSRPTHAGGGTK